MSDQIQFVDPEAYATMRNHTVVDAYEMHTFTKEGWLVIALFCDERIEKVQCEELCRQGSDNTPCAHGSYGSCSLTSLVEKAFVLKAHKFLLARPEKSLLQERNAELDTARTDLEKAKEQHKIFVEMEEQFAEISTGYNVLEKKAADLEDKLSCAEQELADKRIDAFRKTAVGEEPRSVSNLAAPLPSEKRSIR